MIDEIRTDTSYRLGDYFVVVTAYLPHGRGGRVIYHHVGRPTETRVLAAGAFREQARPGNPREPQSAGGVP